MEQFILNARNIIVPEKEFKNPGRGTSRIISFNDNGTICYKRGKSPIHINIRDIIYTYKHFLGKKCSSSDLKEYAPKIYDSKARPAGHSCNCTFFFLILKELKLVDKIEGEGKAHSPFFVIIKK
jgi:hypothetical protein